MYIKVQLRIEPAGEMQRIFYEPEILLFCRYCKTLCQLHCLKGQDLPGPFHRGIVCLERIVRSLSPGTDLKGFQVPSCPLYEKTINMIAEGFFHLPAGYTRIVCGDGIVEANDVGVTGIVHDDGARLSLP